MKKTIFTGLSPNAQADDIWLAFKFLWMPWRWQDGKAIKELEKALKSFLSSQHLFLFESGRTCLYALLKSLNLSEGAEVLLQAYTCVAVPEPVLWAGFKPIYVDIDEKNLTMSPEDLEKKITPQSKVLIIQHTFGQPADMEKLLVIARKHKLFVIEDCAHALGAQYQEKMLGTFGDAAFFSFGRDKVISSVFGGAVTTNDDQLAEKLQKFYDTCPPPPKAWIVQQLLHPGILALGKATYHLVFGKVLLEVAKRFGIISKAVYPEERKGQKPAFILKKMPNALCALALYQFQKLQKFNEHRRTIATFYTTALQDLALHFPALDEFSIFLRYVLRVSNSQKLLQVAKKDGIYLGDWYTQSIAPAGVDYSKIFYDPVTCPKAEKAARETVNLPTDIHISEAQTFRIVQFLKQFYGTHHSSH